MQHQPLHVGPRGGTIEAHQGHRGELFQVCLGSTCLLCESLHVGLAHLNRMERTLSGGPTAAPLKAAS